MLSDRLITCPPVEPFGAVVPIGDVVVPIPHDNRVVSAIEHGGALQCDLFSLQPPDDRPCLLSYRDKDRAFLVG